MLSAETKEYCRGCGTFIRNDCDGYVCDSCAKRLKVIRVIWVLMLIAGFCALLSISGCASNPGSYQPGDVVKARMFNNFPQYEGELVTVKDGLGWKWIKGSMYQGNALQVYEVETSDGRRLAAQEYQLTKVQ